MEKCRECEIRTILTVERLAYAELREVVFRQRVSAQPSQYEVRKLLAREATEHCPHIRIDALRRGKLVKAPQQSGLHARPVCAQPGRDQSWMSLRFREQPAHLGEFAVARDRAHGTSQNPPEDELDRRAWPLQ